MAKDYKSLFKIFLEYFLLPLIITLVVAILLLPQFQNWINTAIPNSTYRFFTILLVVFFLAYVINRIRFRVNGIPKNYGGLF